jgi:acetyltransferase-like isoleucine patch superfamily enzyme
MTGNTRKGIRSQTMGNPHSPPRDQRTSLVSALRHDLRSWLSHWYRYLAWNRRGVRITPDCDVSIHAEIMPTARFVKGTVIDPRAHVGAFTYGTHCRIDNARIGHFVSIGHGALIGPDDHPLDRLSTHPLFFDVYEDCHQLPPAVIGHDVWIGANSVILHGVTVGHGAVIASGAIVTKDVEPYAIVGGVPARVLKYRQPHPEFIAAVEAARDQHELLAVRRQFVSKAGSKAAGASSGKASLSPAAPTPP